MMMRFLYVLLSKNFSLLMFYVVSLIVCAKDSDY